MTRRSSRSPRVSIEIVAPPPVWVPIRPTAPGWYWWRFKGRHGVADLSTLSTFPPSCVDYAGPIPLPEDPEG